MAKRTLKVVFECRLELELVLTTGLRPDVRNHDRLREPQLFVLLTATKTDQSQGSTLSVRVTDVAGNQILCDPVIPGDVLVRLAGGAELTVSKLGMEQSTIVIRNGNFATRQIAIRVDGQVFTLEHLRANETRQLRILAAMTRGQQEPRGDQQEAPDAAERLSS